MVLLARAIRLSCCSRRRRRSLGEFLLHPFGCMITRPTAKVEGALELGHFVFERTTVLVTLKWVEGLATGQVEFDSISPLWLDRRPYPSWRRIWNESEFLGRRRWHKRILPSPPLSGSSGNDNSYESTKKERAVGIPIMLHLF